jgi:serine/threonine-protein kinase
VNIGDVIRGKYRLLRLLGDGGMGSVYEASHELLGTRVAIKVLHADLARRTGLADRFLQEARVAAQIKSPHVVHVTDVDRTPEGTAFLVMELLEGEPLGTMLDRQGRLPIPTACDFTRQILLALEAAHALGVVHRDLKPENVFVTYQTAKPVLKLIDFGIAKLRTNEPGARSLTVAGVLMGTAEYMAPEQAYSADRADARSDLYAVGVMLYEMIAGRRPVAGEDARVIAMKVERGEVTPLVHLMPDVPREIAGLVHRAMAPRPELRFASAAEMRLALEGALSGKRPPTVPIAVVEGPRTVPGGPVDAVLGSMQGPGAMRSPVADSPPPRTERGPLAMTPYAAAPSPAAYGPPPAVTGAPPAARPRKRRGGGMWALIVLPLLLGAGVVAALIVGGGAGGTAPEAQATVTTTATTTSTASRATPAAPTDTIAPLVTTTPHAPGTVRPPAAVDGGKRPPGPGPAPSETVFVPTIPSTLPFPLPDMGDGGSLLPFPIPTSLPTTLPSTLPFPIPGIPGLGPAPSATPSATPKASATL